MAMEYLTRKEQEDVIKWMKERRIPFAMIPKFMDLFYSMKLRHEEKK